MRSLLGSHMMRSAPRGRKGRTFCGAAVILLACLGVSLAGCGSSTPSATPVHRTPFDPANFVDPTLNTNRFQPTKPGMQWVRDGTTTLGSRVISHQVVSTMTDVIREIDGVKTIAMLDQETDAGQIAQVSIDYFALDRSGNVWIMGGYTESYQGGSFTNAVDPWLANVRGAEPGILMPAHPKPAAPPWFIGHHGHEIDGAAEVAEITPRKCVPFACYRRVLAVREGSVEQLDNEFKYYASSVGQILNAPRKYSGKKDIEALINLSQLSPAGVAEFSGVVQRLEQHARITEPQIFGHAPASTRARQ